MDPFERGTHWIQQAALSEQCFLDFLNRVSSEIFGLFCDYLGRDGFGHGLSQFTQYHRWRNNDELFETVSLGILFKNRRDLMGELMLGQTMPVGFLNSAAIGAAHAIGQAARAVYALRGGLRVWLLECIEHAQCRLVRRAGIYKKQRFLSVSNHDPTLVLQPDTGHRTLHFDLSKNHLTA